MKITLFTCNQARHIHLMNKMAEICDECYAIVESKTVFPGMVDDFYKKSPIMKQYFSHVLESEKNIFGDISFPHKNVKSLILKRGDLKGLSRTVLDEALNSDIYIIFGSSFIKGWLIDFLVEKNALNIHMGISPHYKGSSCNFWALYDNSPHLVGATVHMLSKGLDSGDVLYHVRPTVDGCKNPFDYTMKSVSATHLSLVERILNKSIFEMKKTPQDHNLEMRYSRNAEFTDQIASSFLNRNLSIEEISEMISNENDSKGLVETFIA